MLSRILAAKTRSRSSRGSLTAEEMMPYVSCVLDRGQAWAVATMGLLTRCRLEAERTRTSVRAMLQLQV
jgi:hypothetical protein